jgi:hypothetical protein
MLSSPFAHVPPTGFLAQMKNLVILSTQYSSTGFEISIQPVTWDRLSRPLDEKERPTCKSSNDCLSVSGK